ncbi:MAG: cation:proton antiporter [Alphaproteobacteria bacterium]|nr:cation:proton antiporter [Alphaproteobacteria bacterium]MCB9694069.1 cation:proton antiporter [Alphaproteobacteria bacterium]
MTQTALLVTVGGVLLLAPWVEALARRAHLPRVSLLLLLGLVLGPMVLDVLPADRGAWYPFVSEVALAMVGFLLGGELTLENLRKRGRPVVIVSLLDSGVTWFVMSAGLYLLGAQPAVALVLATAATATDPAAVDAVARDLGSDGPNTGLLRGVVAVDDIWGLLLFGLLLAVLGPLQGDGVDSAALLVAAREIGGAIALGGLLGLAAAVLTGRLNPGEPTRLEALGFVALSCGLATGLGVSYLLAAVTMGAVVANFAAHHEVPFREMESLEAPFLVLFFVLSGAVASPGTDPAIWRLVMGYVVLRIVGRLVGAGLGVLIANRRLGGAAQLSPRAGIALLPQAGVALGMTLVAAERVPSVAATVVPVVVLCTLVFEMAGPVGTRVFLQNTEGRGDTPESL